jgi:ribosomal protein S30
MFEFRSKIAAELRTQLVTELQNGLEYRMRVSVQDQITASIMESITAQMTKRLAEEFQIQDTKFKQEIPIVVNRILDEKRVDSEVAESARKKVPIWKR